MGIFDRFKKKKSEQAKPEIKEKKEAAPKYSTLKPKVEGVSVLPAKDAKEIKSKKVKKEDTKDAYKILIKPLVTEKATALGGINKYCFVVAKGANKITIKPHIR